METEDVAAMRLNAIDQMAVASSIGACRCHAITCYVSAHTAPPVRGANCDIYFVALFPRSAMMILLKYIHANRELKHIALML